MGTRMGIRLCLMFGLYKSVGQECMKEVGRKEMGWRDIRVRTQSRAYRAICEVKCDLGWELCIRRFRGR
jgi:hypothetical protein